MPRGRTPAPTVLKLVAGAKKSRINRDEPEPEDGIPTCPSDHPEVQDVWDYTVRQLRKMRTITMADRDALASYCQAVVMHRQATAMLQEEGIITVGGNGSVGRHPAVNIQRESAALIKSFGAEFGLTPASRSRIRVGDQTPKQTDAGAERLLSG